MVPSEDFGNHGRIALRDFDRLGEARKPRSGALTQPSALPMIEVDLVDPSGPNIVDTAQADPNVWVTLAAQANQMAAAKGFVIETGTLLNEASVTLGTLVDVQNWLSRQSVSIGSARGSGGLPPATLAGIVLGISGALLLLFGGRRG